MKKRTCVFAAVLAVLSVLSSLVAAEQEKGASKSFAVSKGGLLEVSIGGGDIKIKGWEKDEVMVKTVGIDESDLDDLEIRQNGKTVSVKFNSSWGSGLDFRLEVSVPSEFDLDIADNGGDIRIEGLSGNLKGTTSCGNIRLGDLGGTINMKTSAGDIQSGNISGDLFLSTSGGDINIGRVTGEADISTSGGEIIIEDVGRKLRASTAGGDVRIRDVGGSADVSTSGGNIQVGKVAGSATLATAGGDIRLMGASGKVKAKTSGGNLDLRQITGSITGSTAGGDITLVLDPSQNEKSRLSTAGGDIRLYFPGEAKATVEARIRITGSWRYMSEDYDITSDYPIEKKEKDRENHEIRATVRVNGGGASVVLETSMGNISIRKGEPLN